MAMARSQVLERLARRLVGDGRTKLYFVSSRRGVIAAFSDRQEAIAFADGRDFLVEGPSGVEYDATWS